MANLTISLDDRTKERFTHFCEDVGLSASSVITVYINTVIRENRIPFPIERDPFYTRANVEHLRRSIAQAEAGKLTPHELIEDD